MTTTPSSAAGPVSSEPGSFLEVVWTDPVTGAKGYLVIDRLVRGVSSGGLRMRAGCTLAEVRGLAQGMTRKEAIHYEPGARYVPLGGAKGGVDFDPYHPDAQAVLFRYLAAMKPLIAENWTTGEDFGVRQQDVDRGLAELGMTSSVDAAYRNVDDREATEARMHTAFTSVVDGVALDELVGGYGVAQAALAAMDRLGMPAAGTRAVIQGFGSMGGATARYLARAGVRVVGLVDVHGVVANPDGLDVETLLLTRDATGGIDRTKLRAGDIELPVGQWLSVPTDVLVPAAMSYCIDANNQQDVQARLIVEAANMPVLPDAEATLAARGVTVSPDFVANSATNAWWWWVFYGDIDGSPEQSFAKIGRRIRALSDDMFDHADGRGITPRAAALEVAAQRLELITERFPVF